MHNAGGGENRAQCWRHNAGENSYELLPCLRNADLLLATVDERRVQRGSLLQLLVVECSLSLSLRCFLLYRLLCRRLLCRRLLCRRLLCRRLLCRRFHRDLHRVVLHHFFVPLLEHATSSGILPQTPHVGRAHG